MRYFIQLSYRGTHFHGWQRQPNAITVQEKIESALSTYLKKDTQIVGCGRTDSGVHAKKYFAHFDIDTEVNLPSLFRSVNALSGHDIAIHKIFPVNSQMHTRFDATSRSYEFVLTTQKDPFRRGLTYFHHSSKTLNLDRLQEAANLLLNYQDFFPFTKTHSDTPHYKCDLRLAQWSINSGQEFIFRITANRFLRGMVRLIVGMCIQVAEGKLPLSDVKTALDNQTQIIKSWSVPAEGLYLADVEYDLKT